MALPPLLCNSLYGLLLLLSIISHISAYEVSSGNSFVCQGRPLPASTIDCRSGDIIQLSSITVYTDTLESAESCKFTPGTACDRKIQSSTDQSLAQELNHLFDWIYFKCHGREKCDPVNSTMPEWWYYIDSKSECAKNGTAGQQYFAAMLIDHSCQRGDIIPTASAPPSTTLREKPTTPTTTTPYPVYLAIYQPVLEGREKVILGVAIGMSIAILIVILVILYCCERYRHHKKFRRVLRMLGAPTAEDDPFDELDYSRKDGWDDANLNEDALGEYTGVKPDEFMTLDKKAMVTSGQIMYDTMTSTMKGRGNSCATLDRGDKNRGVGNISMDVSYTGPVDYDTAENLELERRMAAASQGLDDEHETSAH